MRKVSALTFGMALLLSSLISHCGDDNGPGPAPSASIVGSWQLVFYSEDGVEVEKDMIVEFRADGTGNWGNENISWQTDGNSLTVSWLDEGGHESSVNYDLDRDSLTIAASDDYDLVFVFERMTG